MTWVVHCYNYYTVGAMTDDDEINVKEQVTAMLEDRVKC